MKSIELLEFIAARMKSFHKSFNVGMKVAGNRVEIDELLDSLK
jgi:hypothetical protein